MVLSHFKGYELTGSGGAIKNIGMGSVARAGKMEQHSDSKPIESEEIVWHAECVKGIVQLEQ